VSPRRSITRHKKTARFTCFDKDLIKRKLFDACLKTLKLGLEFQGFFNYLWRILMGLRFKTLTDKGNLFRERTDTVSHFFKNAHETSTSSSKRAHYFLFRNILITKLV
jgi:hypothetical protein